MRIRMLTHVEKSCRVAKPDRQRLGAHNLVLRLAAGEERDDLPEEVAAELVRLGHAARAAG